MRNHKAWTWVLLALVIVCYVLLRLPYIGHLLSFDEAWTALSVRSLATDMDSPFRTNFFRHPPVYMLLGEILAGDSKNIAVTLEYLSMALNAMALVALFFLCKHVWDKHTALWIVAAYALMPAAIFYDTWVKRDCVVTLFGILAILFWVRGQPAISGISLGLAFLGKMTAVFYALPIFLLSLCPPLSKKKLVRLIKVAGISCLLCSWWYFGLWQGRKSFLSFFRGTSGQSSSFAEPFSYYFSRLPQSIGWTGILMAIIGCISIVWLSARDRSRRENGLWLLFLLGPTFIVLSVSKGKPPWMVMALLPGLAVLAGFGASRVHIAGNRLFDRLAGKGNTHSAGFLSALLALLILALLVPRTESYENRLMKENLGVWGLSTKSYEIAQSINRLTLPSDRLLLTTFSYESTSYCPVFHYYVEPRDVVLQRHETPYEELVRLINEHKLDWAVLSPGQFPESRPLTKKFEALLSRRPYVLEGAVIFPLESLYEDDHADFPQTPP
jgi:4-amino-4-deoxy-L-arabinose transferase-like glycosyltransferase